jgi:hypothetical protein
MDLHGVGLRQHAADYVLSQIADWGEPTVPLVARHLHHWVHSSCGVGRILPYAFVVAPGKGLVWWTRTGTEALRHQVRLVEEGTDYCIVPMSLMLDRELIDDMEAYLRDGEYYRWFDRSFTAPVEPSKAELARIRRP